MPFQNGQASGDFREFSGRVQSYYVTTRNTLGKLTSDALTQANPPVVTAANTKSTTLTNITKTGVLGGSVAFTRPDFANGYVGGPVAPAGTYNAGIKPLGIFLNDAQGNPYENAPGVASGVGPYACGSGTTLGVTIWETQILLGGTAGTALTWAAGDKVYASCNGLLTNVIADAYETSVAGTPLATVMGIVTTAPDASNSLLVVDLRV